MNLKQCVIFMLICSVILYIMMAAGMSFVMWDIHYMWVGNWDILARIVYAVIFLCGTHHVLNDYFEEELRC